MAYVIMACTVMHMALADQSVSPGCTHARMKSRAHSQPSVDVVCTHARVCISRACSRTGRAFLRIIRGRMATHMSAHMFIHAYTHAYTRAYARAWVHVHAHVHTHVCTRRRMDRGAVRPSAFFNTSGACRRRTPRDLCRSEGARARAGPR